jgi:serine/threonine protein kinase
MTALPEQPTVPASTPAPQPASTVDDPRVLEALQEYQAALDAGQQPNRQELLARYPEVADALAECLDGLALVRSAASDLSGGTAISPPMPLRQVGEFRILRELGRGGMGLVYEAEQVSLARRVALKVLPPASALDDRQLHRFHTEAQAAAHLQHPHVVAVFAVGCEGGIHYYAMQLIEGPSLARVIEQLRQPVPPEAHELATPTRIEPLPGESAARTARRGTTSQPPAATPATLREAASPSVAWSEAPLRAAGLAASGAAYWRAVARLGVQAAEALAHAHDLGVIHRDIKPSNLLLDGAGQLWVADFGLARFRDDLRLTRPGDILGTIGYLSPEQARGEPADHRADVYALGVTLYELLTLEPAFPGDNRPQLLRQIADEEPPQPRRLNPALPRDLETVVLKAMAKSPAERYANAHALADDLTRFLDGRPVLARRPSLLDRTCKWCGRHRAVAATAVAGLLLAAALLAAGLVWTATLQQKAEWREQQARRAVDRMFTRVADRWLSRAPYLEPVQQEFLEEALAFYEDFLHDNGADPSVRRDTARAYRRVADIRRRLGRPAEAEEAYAQALPLLEALAAEAPGEADTREELALCRNNRGHLFQGLGRFAEGEADYRAARALFARLAEDFPDEPRYWDGLAGSGGNLGTVLHRLNRLDEAEKAYRQALAVQERLAKAHPDVPAYQNDWAGLLNNLANLQRDTGHPGEAEKTYREAIDLQTPLIRQYPADPVYRQAHAVSRHGLGLLLAADRPEAAEKELNAAASLRARLASDFPSVPGYRQELAATLHALGPVLAKLDRPAEAKKTLERAIQLREELLARFPKDDAAARALAESRRLLQQLR